MVKRDNLQKLLSTFKFISYGIKIYIASFCEKSKYDYASKKYGTDCISFKKKFLTNFKNNKSSMFLSRVNYSHIDQKRIISKMFKFYDKSNEMERDKLVTLFTWLSVVMPLFKENKDHLDNECRIVSAEIYNPHTQQLLTQECQKEIKFELSDIIIYKSYLRNR